MMMRRLATAIVVAVLPLAAQAGERAKADVTCKATDQKLVYDCMIMLMGKKSGKPMEGANLVVKADMPSMPMAHNVPPATAKPAGKPGHYQATLELEMHGEWALTMDVSGPTRDRVVIKHQFGEMADQMQHGGDKMNHGKEQMKHGDHGDMKKKQN